METIQLVDNAIDAALVAGKKIMEVYASNDFETVEKDDFSPLTKADREAHRAIVNRLGQTQIPVLSEEGAHPSYSERTRWNKFWLVDPLDGTKEFISRNGEFAVNIALIEKNSPIAGIIYIPVTNELFVGIVSSGAWKTTNPEHGCTFHWISEHGEKLPISEKTSTFKVAVSRSFLNNPTLAFIEKLRKIHPELEIIRKGSSLKFCLIAEGKADVYPRFGPCMEWDTAAGHAIVKAIGKNVFHIDKKTELHYNKPNLMNPHFIVL